MRLYSLTVLSFLPALLLYSFTASHTTWGSTPWSCLYCSSVRCLPLPSIQMVGWPIGRRQPATTAARYSGSSRQGSQFSTVWGTSGIITPWQCRPRDPGWSQRDHEGYSQLRAVPCDRDGLICRHPAHNQSWNTVSWFIYLGRIDSTIGNR